MTPSNAVSGGPEAFHQLADALAAAGKRVFVSYFPNSHSEVPEPFREYRVTSRFSEDIEGNLVVIPEVATHQIRWFRRAEVAVWWLSVDNFFSIPSTSPNYASVVQQHSIKIKGRWRERATWNELRTVRHFVQSEYAKKFLADRNIESSYLGDYINDEFISRAPSDRVSGQIAYNPVKGMETTKRLMERYSHFHWVALRGLSREQLAEALRTSQLYVDFGNHPGRDRIPREAVLQGACILVGRNGSASFAEDMPIDDRYKLNEHDDDFIARFGEIAQEIVANYERHSKDFEAFRSEIRRQKAVFEEEVRQLFHAQGSLLKK